MKIFRTRKGLATLAAIALPLSGLGLAVSPLIAGAAPTGGTLDICKHVLAGTNGPPTVTFNVTSVRTGAIATVTVPVNGGCVSTPEPAGHYIVTEQVPAGENTSPLIKVTPATRLLSGPSAGSVTVGVANGADTRLDVWNSNLVGTLKVCKAIGDAALDGTQWTFSATVDNVSEVVSATAPSSVGGTDGLCGDLGPVKSGTSVTITEAPNTTLGLTTAVTNISTSGGTLTNTNDAAKTATITTDGSSDVVTFTNSTVTPPATGTLKVCKASADSGVVGQVFHFTVTGAGYSSSASVPAPPVYAAPNCVLLTSVPAEPITVQETGLPSYYSVSSITSASATGKNILSSSNLSTQTATLTLPANQTTSVIYTNRTVFSVVEVCKAITSSSSALAGLSFPFTISPAPGNPTPYAGTTLSITAQPGAPLCTEITVPVGTQLVVTEGPGTPSFTRVAGVTVTPGPGGSGGQAGNTAALTVGAGDNTVVFTDQAEGTVKVCKFGADSSTIGRSFSFSINGTPETLVAGGTTSPGCVALTVDTGPVSITEAAAANFHVSQISSETGTPFTTTPATLPSNSSGPVTITSNVSYSGASLIPGGGGNEAEFDIVNAVNKVQVEACSTDSYDMSSPLTAGTPITFSGSYSGTGIGTHPLVFATLATSESTTVPLCSDLATIPAVDNAGNPVVVTFKAVVAGTSPSGYQVVIGAVQAQQDITTPTSSGVGTTTATGTFSVQGPNPSGVGIIDFQTVVPPSPPA